MADYGSKEWHIELVIENDQATYESLIDTIKEVRRNDGDKNAAIDEIERIIAEEIEWEEEQLCDFLDKNTLAFANELRYGLFDGIDTREVAKDFVESSGIF